MIGYFLGWLTGLLIVSALLALTTFLILSALGEKVPFLEAWGSCLLAIAIIGAVGLLMDALGYRV